MGFSLESRRLIVEKMDKQFASDLDTRRKSNVVKKRASGIFFWKFFEKLSNFLKFFFWEFFWEFFSSKFLRFFEISSIFILKIFMEVWFCFKKVIAATIPSSLIWKIKQCPTGNDLVSYCVTVKHFKIYFRGYFE